MRCGDFSGESESRSGHTTAVSSASGGVYRSVHQFCYNGSHKETAADLRYLQGKGTSLGGLRPKCTVIDRNGRLSPGKFPSVNDERNVTRAEVLALHLARRAGINTASARVEEIQNTSVAIIERFDRSETWLSEEDGPIAAVSDLLARAPYFSLGPDEALAVLAEVVHAVSRWKIVAMSAAVGLKTQEIDELAPAFEHDQMRASHSLVKKYPTCLRESAKVGYHGMVMPRRRQGRALPPAVPCFP